MNSIPTVEQSKGIINAARSQEEIELLSQVRAHIQVAEYLCHNQFDANQASYAWITPSDKRDE